MEHPKHRGQPSLRTLWKEKRAVTLVYILLRTSVFLVMLAQLSLLLRGAVSLRLLAFNRLLHLLLLTALVRVAVQFMPGVLPVYSSLQARVITTHRLPVDAAVVAFLFICAALYKARQSLYNRKSR